MIASGCPKSNGQIERFNKTITPLIAKLIDSSPYKGLSKIFNEAELLLNNTINRSTNETPSKLLFGVHQKCKVDDQMREYLESKLNVERDLTDIRHKASEKIKETQSKNKKYYDKKCRVNNTFNVGDLVYIPNRPEVGVSRKLQKQFKGPYQIKKILPNNRFVVADIEGFQINQVPFSSVFDPCNLKRWIPNDL